MYSNVTVSAMTLVHGKQSPRQFTTFIVKK